MEQVYSTEEIKALYDFSLLHCQILSNTGSTTDLRRAENKRDWLYKELVHRMENVAFTIEHTWHKNHLT